MNPYLSCLTLEELTDALSEMIDLAIRKGTLSTNEDWQAALTQVLQEHAQPDNLHGHHH